MPCCHFKLNSPDEEDFRPCDVVIPESDIRRLIRREEDFAGGKRSDDDGDWRARGDEGEDGGGEGRCGEGRCGSKDGDEKRTAAGGENRPWTRYQKLKFDDHHGKDSVRRCPKCDEARLFDEKGMRRFQSIFLAQRGHDAQAAGGAASGIRRDVATGNTNRLERAFGMLRQGRRDAEVVPGAAAASNQNVE